MLIMQRFCALCETRIVRAAENGMDNNAPKHSAPCCTSANRNSRDVTICMDCEVCSVERAGKSFSKSINSFSQIFLPLPGAWAQLSSSLQHTGVARAGSRLLCRQNQRRGETMAGFPGHRKGRSAVSREEKTVSVVEGCYDSSFIPGAAQSWSLQRFIAENLQSKD